MLSGPIYAALDLGTNNCRMLVARPVERGFAVIDAFSRITRLGEGVAASGRLSPAAMSRTVDALKACADRMRRQKVTRARLVATEACRRAVNHADFARRVEGETGLILDVIAPDEEAALALAGCAPLLEPDRHRALVFDIGGGSTELMWVDNGADGRHIRGMTSLPLGVVTLSEARGPDLMTPDGYERVVADMAGQLADFESSHDITPHLAQGTVQMLGTSGTVTTLGALHLDLPRYDRQMVDGLDLELSDIRVVVDRLMRMSVQERARHPCVGPERADLVLAGCAILDAICRLWPLRSLRVADRGVREGVLLGLIASEGEAS